MTTATPHPDATPTLSQCAAKHYDASSHAGEKRPSVFSTHLRRWEREMGRPPVSTIDNAMLAEFPRQRNLQLRILPFAVCLTRLFDAPGGATVPVSDCHDNGCSARTGEGSVLHKLEEVGSSRIAELAVFNELVSQPSVAGPALALLVLSG